MKKLKYLIISIAMFMCVGRVSFAHGGNITGWKDKNSNKITEYNGMYYGYHKEDGEKHYHQVKWDEENQKWIIIAPAIYYNENFNKIEKNHGESTNKIKVELDSVVDGDTAKFIMDGEKITARFLGINTKETVDPEIGEEAWGREASDFTKDKLKNATKIELEFDSSADEKDKYDRYLVWVWVDDKLFQNILIEEGLAETYMLQNNYKYAGMLQESEEKAKNNKLGIWSDETSSRANDETKKQINEENTAETVDIKLEYMITGVIVILIINIISITHKKKKRK